VSRRISIEEYKALTGRARDGVRRSRSTEQRHKLALLLFFQHFEAKGFKYAGPWRKGMEATPDLLVSEYPFAREHGRRYRFDIAFLGHNLAVEIQGGRYIIRQSSTGKVLLGGAHHSPEGRRRDMEKQNLATLLGWRVIEAEWEDIESGATAKLVSQLLEVKDE
jgi:hypothetical protein